MRSSGFAGVSRRRRLLTLAMAALLGLGVFEGTGGSAEATVSCPAVGGWTTLVTGEGPVARISARGDVSSAVALRIEFSGAVPGHQVYVDTDDERLTGMWSYQSHVSGSGWDRLVDAWGTAYAHAADRPNAWEWSPLSAPGFARSVSGDLVDLCLPAAVLGSGSSSRLRVAVQAGGEWLPEVFLPGAAYPPEREPSAPEPREEMGRLAIHYGAHPWTVRGCTDGRRQRYACAVRAFGTFSDVVLGGGLELRSHPSHRDARRFVRALRRRNPDIRVWGYVSLVGTAERAEGPRRLARRARAWRSMGATGIFLDEADLCRPAWGEACRENRRGRRVPITRARQQRVVHRIHRLGMPVFANAYSPYDILAPAHGVPSPLGGGHRRRAPDRYLLESPTVVGGSFRTGLDAAVSDAKFRAAWGFREALGIRTAAVDTFGRAVPDVADERSPFYRKGWEAASAAGVDVYGFTNAAYSAPAHLAANLALLDPPGDP